MWIVRFEAREALRHGTKLYSRINILLRKVWIVHKEEADEPTLLVEIVSDKGEAQKIQVVSKLV